MPESLSQVLLKWATEGLLLIGSGFMTLAWFVYRADKRRLKDVEDKVAKAITKAEVDVIVGNVKTEFRSDHKGLEAKMERIEDNLRKEIHNSHASLQDGIDKVVNILLTRDENDRRRRGE